MNIIILKNWLIFHARDIALSLKSSCLMKPEVCSYPLVISWALSLQVILIGTSSRIEYQPKKLISSLKAPVISLRLEAGLYSCSADQISNLARRLMPVVSEVGVGDWQLRCLQGKYKLIFFASVVISPSLFQILYVWNFLFLFGYLFY